MTDRKATILIDGENPIDLPIHKGTLGQDVIDVGTLGNPVSYTHLRAHEDNGRSRMPSSA